MEQREITMLENINFNELTKKYDIHTPLAKHYSYKDKARLNMVVILTGELNQGHYQSIKQVCEYAGVENIEALESSYSHVSTFKMQNPDKSIFMDMIYVLYDKAEDDITISLYADWVFAKRTEFKDIMKKGQTFEDFLERYNRIEDKDAIFEAITDEIAEIFYQAHFGRDDRKLHLMKFNDGDVIFTSKQYTRYVGKRYAELIEYVKEEYGDLFEDTDEDFVFSDLLYIFGKMESRYTPGTLSSVGLNATTTLKDFRLGLGSVKTQVTDTEIKELVDGWIGGYVIDCCEKYANEYGEEMSKLYLARKCIPDVREMFYGISYMYERHLLYKLCNSMLDKQYLNFTWDSVIKGSSKDRAKDTIEDLKGTITAYEMKVETLNRSLTNYKERLAAAEAKNIKASTIDIANIERRYEKALSDKDEEILRLREQLRSKDDYIAVLSTPQQEEVSEDTITADILTSKRYLFVGCISEEYQELKRMFPNSLFMENPQYNLSNVNVDAIVLLIRNMSHKLFYKVQNAPNLKDTPRVYCNARGMKSICREIYNTVFD